MTATIDIAPGDRIKVDSSEGLLRIKHLGTSSVAVHVGISEDFQPTEENRVVTFGGPGVEYVTSPVGETRYVRAVYESNGDTVVSPAVSVTVEAAQS